MGSSVFSHDAYVDRARERAVSGAPIFHHDADVRAGKVNALHPSLDPKLMKNGVRESRDSDAHPNSVPIIFALDVTGSMGGIPPIVQSKLGKLMTTILTSGALQDPQILFAAIGDATCDQVGLQAGQFESGLEMKDDLTKFFLERESNDCFIRLKPSANMGDPSMVCDVVTNIIGQVEGTRGLGVSPVADSIPPPAKTDPTVLTSTGESLGKRKPPKRKPSIRFGRIPHSSQKRGTP